MAKFKFISKEAESRAQTPIKHLIAKGGRCYNQVDVHKSMRLEVWFIGARSYILRFFDDGGWDVYAPVDNTNNIDATLAKVV